MNTNPINLTVRFLLEIAMLAILGCWGWHLATGWPRFAFAVVLPAIAAVLWGLFRIPNDPKPAPVAVPGIIRLSLELILFGFAVWILFELAYTNAAYIIAAVVILHYIVSYDRTWAMLRNKPYEGFKRQD